MGDFLKSDAFHLAWGSPFQLRLHELTKPRGSNLAVGMEAGISHLVPVDVVGFFLITPINHPTGVFLQGDQRVGSFPHSLHMAPAKCLEELAVPGLRHREVLPRPALGHGALSLGRPLAWKKKPPLGLPFHWHPGETSLAGAFRGSFF